MCNDREREVRHIAAFWKKSGSTNQNRIQTGIRNSIVDRRQLLNLKSYWSLVLTTVTVEFSAFEWSKLEADSSFHSIVIFNLVLNFILPFEFCFDLCRHFFFKMRRCASLCQFVAYWEWGWDYLCWGAGWEGFEEFWSD